MTGDAFAVDVGDVGDGGAEAPRRLCRLRMDGVRFEEAPLGGEGRAALAELGRRCGWSPGAAPRNASVARPKTLVALASAAAVHGARAPDGGFAAACDAMDGSTGVYLHAPREDGASGARSYECRQFPRASGYPEDPATGIAAAALAASLRFGSDDDDGAPSVHYDMYQGTAMGRPSLIQVLDLRKEEGGEGLISFKLQGWVNTDATYTVRASEYFGH
jgi:PhzF family phenazine biosynthesis protein